jgi:putative membrane protein
MNFKLPHILLFLYIALFVACAISPYDRTVWFAENLPIVIIVLVLAFTYKKFQFSNTAYLLMSVLVFLHTIGGHYTFERVPFDFITNLFGFERNHYDRMAHFTVGFYAFAIAEFMMAKRLIRSKWTLLIIPICVIFTVAATYEIIEWQAAIWGDPQAGLAFLGSQGDIWDAQKDMLADGLGAIVVMLLFWLARRRDLENLAQPI